MSKILIALCFVVAFGFPAYASGEHEYEKVETDEQEAPPVVVRERSEPRERRDRTSPNYCRCLEPGLYARVPRVASCLWLDDPIKLNIREGICSIVRWRD